MTPCSRLHPDDMDVMAHALADHIIETTVTTAVEDGIIREVEDIIGKRRRPRRRVDFAAYYRFLAPHEARFKRALKKYWDDQRRTVINNMKRTPGGRGLTAARTKGLTIDELMEQWMFATNQATKQLTVIYKSLADKLLYATAAREAAAWGLSVNWDVYNENIGKWLDSYSVNLAGEINTQTLDKLKGSLEEGWKAGESISDLSNRVRDTYEDFEKWRADMIARSETIRGSNEGALETYRASGVVDRTMWVATPDERECPICEGLDGKVAELDEPFPFEDTYGDGTCPPAHPNCRCCLVPVLEGEEL